MHPLDNPIWTALTTSLAHLAESKGFARRFPADVSVLGAVFPPTDQAYNSLAQISGANPVGLFRQELAPLPAGWTVISSVPLLQMVYEQPAMPDVASANPRNDSTLLPQWIELTAADSPEMMALAELTKPGPFGQRTHELGAFLGVRRDGKLAAMAGE